VYRQREGHSRVPHSHVESGYNLGKWVGVQRGNRENLSIDRKAQLEELGFVWDPLDADWENGFTNLQLYKDREGHCRVPAKFVQNGFSLGIWVVTQRRNAERISKEHKHRLDALGFVWDPSVSTWEKGFHHLKKYAEREGNCCVPHHHIESDYPLGQWVNNQRGSRETLSEDRKQRLEGLGFIWDVLKDNWEKGFRHLQQYKDRMGHCRVPAGHKENGFGLGRWVSKQRTNKTKLSKEQRRRLDTFGFVWDPYEQDWEEGFSHLKAYKDRVGHCNISRHHKEKGFSLGQWVGVQRVRQAELPNHRRKLLNDLGFVWNQADENWQEGFDSLRRYKEREGHCRVPPGHYEGKIGRASCRERV